MLEYMKRLWLAEVVMWSWASGETGISVGAKEILDWGTSTRYRTRVRLSPQSHLLTPSLATCVPRSCPGRYHLGPVLSLPVICFSSSCSTSSCRHCPRAVSVPGLPFLCLLGVTSHLLLHLHTRTGTWQMVVSPGTTGEGFVEKAGS